MADNCTNIEVCPCQPLYTVAIPNPPPPPIVFYNTQQCATAYCPSGQAGGPSTFCTPANQFSSTISQADANNQAYQYAFVQATQALQCSLAGQLSGQSWKIPCTNGAPACSCSDPSDTSVTAQGTVGHTYTVRLRIRGLVECKNYNHNGVAGTQNGFLFTCTNPTQSVPAAPGDGANEYALVISNPAATLFLNNLIGSNEPTASQVIDYQIVIHVTTGAMVTLKARTIDSIQWGNVSSLVVNAAPPPIVVTEPYAGQFLQMDVLDIS